MFPCVRINDDDDDDDDDDVLLMMAMPLTVEKLFRYFFRLIGNFLKIITATRPVFYAVLIERWLDGCRGHQISDIYGL